MILVNKNTFIVQDAENVERLSIPKDDSLLNDFKTQLNDWVLSLNASIDSVDNKSILVFQALFIVELWLKLIIIEKLSIVKFMQRIPDSEINFNGFSNEFSLSMVCHKIDRTINKLIECRSFDREKNLLIDIYNQCQSIASGILSNLDNYQDLKYNHDKDKRIIVDLIADSSLKGDIKRLINYAKPE